MPLFERYDIAVEFQRHLQLGIGAYRERRAPVDVTDILSPDFGSEICPIELFVDEMEVVPGEHPIYPDTGPAMAPHFTALIPYRGDDELWHLYPRKLDRHPDGEIFRGHLVLVSCTRSEVAAWRQFDRRLDDIVPILLEQKDRIREFETNPAAWVERVLARTQFA